MIDTYWDIKCIGKYWLILIVSFVGGHILTYDWLTCDGSDTYWFILIGFFFSDEKLVSYWLASY